MRKLIVVLIAGLLIGHLSAQTEPELYKKVVGKFIINYNEGKYESIFKQLSSEMKVALNAEKASAFFTGLKKKYGKIKKYDLANFGNQGAIYKVELGKIVWALRMAVNSEEKISGFLLLPDYFDKTPAMKRNKTSLILPFKGEWYVQQGGDTEKQNHHVVIEWQKGAIDFIIVDESMRPFSNSGRENTDHYCFGKEIIAPCNGEVVMAVDGIKDNHPGEMNPAFLLGNAVILKAPNREYIYLCHFKQYSVKVKQGQKVKKGDLLGLCGNSGRSSMPHLHFHIQSEELVNSAKGVKCYFEKIKVNGKTGSEHSPVKREKVKNN